MAPPAIEVNMETTTEIAVPAEPEKFVRRSSRQITRSRASIDADAPYAGSQATTTRAKPASTRTNDSRRNPKRKASEAARLSLNLPDNLLEEALAPLSAKDIEDWDGWVELESEPAFFNIILRDLGVKDVKAEEIFTIDQTSLDILPKPVYGLIFLFQYTPTLEDEEDEEDSSPVWFANQTTSNACATVALLNIVMNAETVDLGTKLQAFKESTKNLSTALRGYHLSADPFIRKIHNSFTRRMDHLNVDLSLENEMSDAATAQAKKRATPKKGGSARVKRIEPEYGFHFIAYVPAGGFVWELDGLRGKPQRLGSVDEGDWTTIARPQIEARMLQYEESQLSFNLLALCQSPLAHYSQAITASIANIHYLHAEMRNETSFTNIVSSEAPVIDLSNSSQLSQYDLQKATIETAPIPASLKQQISDPDFNTAAAHELHQQLVIEAKACMGEFRAEIIAMADDEQRVKGRKKDYSAALHKWVSKLAEKGVLEDMIKTSAS